MVFVCLVLSACATQKVTPMPEQTSGGQQGQVVNAVSTTVVLTDPETPEAPNLATREAMLERVNRSPEGTEAQTETVQAATPPPASESQLAPNPVTTTLTDGNAPSPCP